MPAKNTSSTYGSIAKTLHWTIAMLVIGLIILGVSLHSIPRAYAALFYTLHKSFGVLALLLMVIRTLWTSFNVKPALPKNTPTWQRLLSKSVHFLLYLTAFIMPLSGWIMVSSSQHGFLWFFLFNGKIPGITTNPTLSSWCWSLHHETAWIISAFIIVHTLAALKHHIIDKDDVLKRMLPKNWVK